MQLPRYPGICIIFVVPRHSKARETIGAPLTLPPSLTPRRHRTPFERVPCIVELVARQPLFIRSLNYFVYASRDDALTAIPIDTTPLCEPYTRLNLLFVDCRVSEAGVLWSGTAATHADRRNPKSVKLPPQCEIPPCCFGCRCIDRCWDEARPQWLHLHPWRTLQTDNATLGRYGKRRVQRQ